MEGVDYKVIDGGICAPQGISACGIQGGFRKEPGRKDMALIVADETCTAAGVFTQNIFCAAPVQVSRKHVADGKARAIIVNSGNANAATGEPGLAVAEGTAKIVAAGLGCDADDILVCSTGIIGQQLDLSIFETAVPAAMTALSTEGGHDAAGAIMTTDTVEKEHAIEFQVGENTYRVGGMCKGAGMISPNMATMIAILTSDAPVVPAAAQAALRAAAGVSFNKVTVDSDTSTNDTCLMLCTGAAGGELIDEASTAFPVFAEAVRIVCTELAKDIARDGEGSTKLVEVTVTGAANDADADLCARAIANSPLVKTAVAGHDANWGRIAAAAGRSGATFKQEDVSIDILGIPVCRDGLTVAFDEDEALKRFEDTDIAIAIDLGAGEATARIWTCDLTHEYIHINADYRS